MIFKRSENLLQLGLFDHKLEAFSLEGRKHLVLIQCGEIQISFFQIECYLQHVFVFDVVDELADNRTQALLGEAH